ncbi:type II toxin-antitoxin system VapC family toxin [Curtanaerobium respiraculi]|uniref:type II toxin-antitoxin system VapC family toxin n=1 Tax=Curtanaerobium respiraculi TaxID=2949669 RepID=UPI0024B343E7|nr:PIN domain-containing protein [Curtanaerobium respiraculi]
MRRSGLSFLIDTNVWLDHFFDNRRDHEVATAALTRAYELQVPLFYASPSTKDVFYQAAWALKRDARNAHGTLTEEDARNATETAWSVVENMDELATAVGCDSSDVWLAQKYRCLHNDLEDNLIFAAANRAHVTQLVTSDERLIEHAPVATLTPKDALALLEL